MDVHTLHMVVIDNAGATDLSIDGILNQNITTGIVPVSIGGDSAVDDTFAYVDTQDPVIGFSTNQLATLLASCGLSGFAVAKDADEPGAQIYLKKRAIGGIFASGSVHQKFTVPNGILIVQSIDAALKGGNAVAQCELHSYYDGTNAPLAVAASSALAGTPLATESFRAGKFLLNGTEIEGVQNINLALGITMDKQFGGGSPYCRHVSIGARKPRLTIRTLDIAKLQSLFTVAGVAQAATDSVAYLENRASGSGNDISFTFDEGIAWMDISADHQGEAVGTVTYVPVSDGTNDIVVISTTATMP